MARGRGKKRDRSVAPTAQLDLFAIRSATTMADRVAVPIATTPNATSSTASRSRDERLTSVIDFVLGKDRGRGRPEKLLSVGPAMPSKRLLDVREAAERLGLSKSTLDKMRCSGRGPRFIRATDRAIRYDPADLDAFADARRRRSTSEEAIAALNS